MLSDILTETDTTWTVYTRQSATGCAYPLVPSIIVDPIMSSLITASWADKGTITRDTLDTCVVEIQDTIVTVQDTVELETIVWTTYSIDMQRGVVIGFVTYGGPGSAQHQYIYGYEREIYYLRKVTFSFDTTIEYAGGYEFYNIRLNGEPVPVINPGKPKPERFSIQWLDRRQGILSLTGIAGPARAALFDIRGRRITQEYREINGMFELNRLCPSSGCPSGPMLLWIENSGTTRVFPAVLVR